jgi:hypothetical protein
MSTCVKSFRKLEIPFQLSKVTELIQERRSDKITMIQDKSLAAKHHTSAHLSTQYIKVQGDYLKKNRME